MTTKKKATSFRLSDEALEQLANLAARKKISQAAAVELALREMTESTPEQKEWQKAAMESAFLDLVELVKVEQEPSKQALKDAKFFFSAGYRKGWVYYQLRHNLDEVLELKGLSPREFRVRVASAYLKH